MKRLIYIAAAAIFSIACGALGSIGPEATVTALPPTETPIPEPTATPTAEPTEEPITSEMASCQHPFFPVDLDAEWVYTERENGVDVLSYTVTYEQAGENAFRYVAELDPESNTEITEGGFSNLWRCSDGGLIQTDFGSLNLATDEGILSYETESFEGVFLPEPADLVPGATWQATYDVILTIEQEGTQLELNSAITIDSRYAGTEEVTVPAGTFEAIRVERTIETESTGFINTTSIIDDVVWFAEGVGLIRIQDDVGDTVLQSFTEGDE